MDFRSSFFQSYLFIEHDMAKNNYNKSLFFLFINNQSKGSKTYSPWSWKCTLKNAWNILKCFLTFPVFQQYLLSYYASQQSCEVDYVNIFILIL